MRGSPAGTGWYLAMGARKIKLQDGHAYAPRSGHGKRQRRCGKKHDRRISALLEQAEKHDRRAQRDSEAVRMAPTANGNLAVPTGIVWTVKRLSGPEPQERQAADGRSVG